MDLERCANSMRRAPLGYDRFHRRYWVFPQTATGLFVESGWMTKEEDFGQISELENASNLEVMESPCLTAKEETNQEKEESFVSATEEVENAVEEMESSSPVTKEGATQDEESFVSASEDVEIADNESSSVKRDESPQAAVKKEEPVSKIEKDTTEKGNEKER